MITEQDLERIYSETFSEERIEELEKEARSYVGSSWTECLNLSGLKSYIRKLEYPEGQDRLLVRLQAKVNYLSDCFSDLRLYKMPTLFVPVEHRALFIELLNAEKKLEARKKELREESEEKNSK